jgi:hypothetical protein
MVTEGQKSYCEPQGNLISLRLTVLAEFNGSRKDRRIAQRYSAGVAKAGILRKLFKVNKIFLYCQKY